MGNISYSAVVLDEKSKQKLIQKFKNIIPENWMIMCDHMTINSGEIDLELKKYLGLAVRLSINDMAIDENVIAVGVSGFKSFNKKPHITLAINAQNDGEQMMSNKLTDWKMLKRPLFIVGKVTEVEFK